jgi:PAS domain S-box-containing protein
MVGESAAPNNLEQARREDVQRLEQMLSRRELQLAEVERIAQVGSWDWDLSSDRGSWSQELYRLLGAPADSLEPSYENFLAATHPDDRARLEAAFRDALDRGEPLAVVHRIRRRDGGDRLVISRAQVISDSAGSPHRIVGATLDLSDYRGIADGMRARHEQLLAAEELAGMGSFEWDVEGNGVTWSDGMYRLFGLQRGEFAGTYEAYLELVHPDDRGDRRTHIDALTAAGDSEALQSEHRIVRPDGEVRRIASKVKALRDDSRVLRSVIGVCRDVTED